MKSKRQCHWAVIGLDTLYYILPAEGRVKLIVRTKAPVEEEIRRITTYAVTKRAEGP